MVITDKNSFPKPILINNTAIEILKLFLSNPTQEYTILEISKKTGINYRQIYEQIVRYEKDGTIIIAKKGHSKVCRIILSMHRGLYAYIEDIKAAQFIKNFPKIRVILESLKKIGTSYYTLLVFGSYAKEGQTKKSDLDLLFIVPENIDKFKNDIENSFRMLSYKTDINVISESDFINLKNEQSINIRNQIINNHIILYGAENYYRLIS
jgi:predicted nucleotidyltransferase